MIWEDNYIEGKISDEKIRKTYCGNETTMKIEMEKKQILMSGLVTFIKALLCCTQANTTKDKQSKGKCKQN